MGWGLWNSQFLVSLPYRCYILNLVKIGPAVLEIEEEEVNAPHTTDDDGHQPIKIGHLSDSGDLIMKVRACICISHQMTKSKTKVFQFDLNSTNTVKRLLNLTGLEFGAKAFTEFFIMSKTGFAKPLKKTIINGWFKLLSCSKNLW